MAYHFLIEQEYKATELFKNYNWAHNIVQNNKKVHKIEKSQLLLHTFTFLPNLERSHLFTKPGKKLLATEMTALAP